MKRVECECGRMVRLDAEGGDRALCPYCGAKLARQPDEESAASPAEAGKSPEFNKGLLVVAAILGVLLLVGGGTAIVLLKKDRPAKDTPSTAATDPKPAPRAASPTASDKSTIKAKDPLAGPFTLRLMGPRKKGDVREAVLKGETVTRFTVVEADKRDPEPPKTTQVELECRIRTLATDDAGRETAWEFTIVSVRISRLDPGKLPAPGTVLKAQRAKASGIVFPAAADLPEPLKAALTRAAGQRLGYWPTSDEDAMFSSGRPQMPGTAWTANEDALTAWFTGVTEVVWDRASAKLLEVVKAGPYAVVEAQFEAHGKLKDKTPSGLVPVGAAVNELTGKVQYRLPLVDFQGPTWIASRVEVVSKDEGKNGVGSEELLSDDYTLEIRYSPREIDLPSQGK